MEWHRLKLFDSSLKRDGKRFDDSDPRITEALDRPGLYVIRLNSRAPGTHYHVIKLGRTEPTSTAKLKNRLRDYFSANPHQFTVVALALARRPRFARAATSVDGAMDDRLARFESAAMARGKPVLEAERDLLRFVNTRYAAARVSRVSTPTPRQEYT